jgi:hypothetical protein
VAAFAVLAALFAITWHLTTGGLNFRNLVCIWLTIGLYGAVEEVTQPIVNRSASGIDWIADVSGAALGLAIYWFVVRRWVGEAESSNTEAGGQRSSRWFHFSLKTLFVLMTLTAVACNWFMLPTIHAQRFIVALQRKDYATAESLFVSETNTFPGNYKNYDHFNPQASLAPLTWTDFWNGERRIGVGITFGNDGWLMDNGGDITARRRGLDIELMVP